MRQFGSSSRHHPTLRSYHSNDALFAVLLVLLPEVLVEGGDVLLSLAAGKQIPEGEEPHLCSPDSQPATRDEEMSLWLKGLLGRRIDEAAF